MLCNQCPRMCNAIRTSNDNVGGVCGMPLSPVVARAALHFWEEPCISGQNGSGTVFLSGCSLHCVFCQNNDISQKNKGKAISELQLSRIFENLEKQGAHNINFVTPTHYTDAIINALKIYRPKIPIVYNSSGYEKIETLERLKEYIDVYLIDFKYSDSLKASMYSGADNYVDICKSALLEAYSQQNKCVFKDGIMQKGVIVRHLLLPQATRDAIEIFDWVKDNLPQAYFSLMSQYVPMGNALNMPPINRTVTSREYNKVVDFIADSGFENCYIQECSSANKSFIPDFDFSGI